MKTSLKCFALFLLVLATFLQVIGFNWSKPMRSIEQVPNMTMEWLDQGSAETYQESSEDRDGVFVLNETLDEEKELTDEELFGYSTILESAYPPPENPYVLTVNPYSGYVMGQESNCISHIFRNPRHECHFEIGSLYGRYPLLLTFTQYNNTNIEVEASVGEGGLRVYMPYGNVFQYIDVLPGETGTINGSVSQHPQAAGDINKWALYIEALDEEAVDLELSIVSR